MSEWKEVKLGDVADLIMGQSPKSIYYNNHGEGMKFLQGNRTFGKKYPTFDTYTTKITKEVEKNDILFTVRAPVGDINIANDSICIGRGLAGIRAKENQDFLYYSLIYNTERIRMAENGTTYGSINKTDLENFKIKLPNLETQTKIADVLSTYDKLIENNNRRIEILEQTAEELYKEWFVRMRFPGYEKTKFDKGIPEGWEVRRVKDLGEVITGKTPPTNDEENYGGEVMFVKTPDMNGNLFTIETESYLSNKGNDSQPKKLIPEGSIMVSCIGTGGVVSINGYPAHTNQQINSIILNKSLEREWAYFTLRSMKGTIELFGATGATMTNLSKGKFEDLKILYPINDLVLRYHTLTKGIFSKIKNLNIQNQNLKKQRDLLLPRLMNGTITVK